MSQVTSSKYNSQNMDHLLDKKGFESFTQSQIAAGSKPMSATHKQFRNSVVPNLFDESVIVKQKRQDLAILIADDN
jgi:hypothetical protein